MNCRLALTATAQRQLGRLPERYALAIVEFLTGPLVENPLVVGRELHGPLGQRSARRGVYRVIYRIENDQVIVLRVDHRADVYRL